MAQITINVDDKIVQSYLNHYGEVVGRDIKFKDLTDEQREGVLSSLGDELAGEIEMRTDDHSGFETENYFFGVFGD